MAVARVSFFLAVAWGFEDDMTNSTERRLLGPPDCHEGKWLEQKTWKERSVIKRNREPGESLGAAMARREARLEPDDEALNTSLCVVKRPTTFRSKASFSEVVLLWSFPGSGNTWARMLFEAATSIYTGSIYRDKSLAPSLKGELGPTVTKEDCEQYSVIKAHPHIFLNLHHACGTWRFDVCDQSIDKVILLVRHPFSAAWADFQRKTFRSHTKGALFSANGKLIVQKYWLGHWQKEALEYARKWANLWKAGDESFRDWMDLHSPDTYFLLRFEDLQDSSIRVGELKHAIAFAGLDSYTTPSSIACAFDDSKSSAFKRPNTTRRSPIAPKPPKQFKRKPAPRRGPLNKKRRPGGSHRRLLFGSPVPVRDETSLPQSPASPTALMAWKTLPLGQQKRAADLVRAPAALLGYIF